VLAAPISVIASNVKKVEKLARECQAGKDKSCLKLAKIAKNDKNWKVRMAAVEKLTDQAILADIAKNDKDDDVRMTAIGKLTNQAIIADIAKNDEDDDIRIAAVEKLTDQAIIADIAKTEVDWHLQVKIFLEVSNQVLLAGIAKDRLPTAADIAKGELKLLPNETVRTQLRRGRNVKIYRNRKGVVEAVEIGVNWNAGFVKFKGKRVENLPALAALRLTDQALLADVAKSAFRSSVRLLAIERLTDPDQVLLTEIFKADKNEVLREAAAKRLIEESEDQELLADIAKNAKGEYIRAAAVKKLEELKKK